MASAEFKFNPSTGAYGGQSSGTGLGDIINSIMSNGAQIQQANINAGASMNNNWLDNWVRSQGNNLNYLSGQSNNALQDLLNQRQMALGGFQSANQLAGQKYVADRGVDSARVSAEPALLGQQNKQKRFETVWDSPMLMRLLGGNETLYPQSAQAQTPVSAAPVQQSPGYTAGRPGPGQEPYRPSPYAGQYNPNVLPQGVRPSAAAAPSASGGNAPTGAAGGRYMTALGSGSPQARREPTQLDTSPFKRYSAGPLDFVKVANGTPLVRLPNTSSLRNRGGGGAAPAPAPQPAAGGGQMNALSSGQGQYSPPPLPSNLGINPMQEKQILNNATAQFDRANQADVYRDMPNKYATSGFATTGRGLAADQGLANYRAAQGKAAANVQVPLQVGQFNAPLKAQLAGMQQDRYNQFQNRGIQRTGQGLGFLGGLLSG